jgi:hypothetical protein
MFFVAPQSWHCALSQTQFSLSVHGLEVTTPLPPWKESRASGSCNRKSVPSDDGLFDAVLQRHFNASRFSGQHSPNPLAFWIDTVPKSIRAVFAATWKRQQPERKTVRLLKWIGATRDRKCGLYWVPRPVLQLYPSSLSGSTPSARFTSY